MGSKGGQVAAAAAKHGMRALAGKRSAIPATYTLGFPLRSALQARQWAASRMKLDQNVLLSFKCGRVFKNQVRPSRQGARGRRTRPGGAPPLPTALLGAPLQACALYATDRGHAGCLRHPSAAQAVRQSAAGAAAVPPPPPSGAPSVPSRHDACAHASPRSASQPSTATCASFAAGGGPHGPHQLHLLPPHCRPAGQRLG